VSDQTNGQKIRAHRERKRLTTLQCARNAGCPHEVWNALEQDEPVDVSPTLRVFVDRFTDGEVPCG
jgi:transcriptional regulator with XRE-family HTH domain